MTELGRLVDDLVSRIDALEREVAELLEGLETQESPWLDAAAAADYLAMPLGTLRNLTSARAIPFVKEGRRVFYDRRALDEWRAARADGPAAPIRLRAGYLRAPDGGKRERDVDLPGSDGWSRI